MSRMFGVHQPHPDDPRYPKWSATRWPEPFIKTVDHGFKAVDWNYFEPEWSDYERDAIGRQVSFNEVAKKFDWSALYAECEAHNKPLREARQLPHNRQGER